MITAAFRFDPADKITKVSISGHAEMASYGYDTVCASVSSLLIATINGLEEYVGINTHAKVNEGCTEFTIETENTIQSTQAQAIVHTLYMAMEGLEDEYGDYIQVTVTED